jgi:hypothetical protein
MQPRLTVGVPHLDRTEFLGETIDCLLDQTVPCKILVADQGMTAATAELMAKYEGNPLVKHRRTDATCLWENWREAAEAAMDDGAECFAWCQDDDIVSRHYSSRINLAFAPDGYVESQTWVARLAIAEHKRLAIWFSGVGPMVPMDLMRNIPTEIPGELMTPIAYFTSWALSPAAAFRCGQDFRDALAEVPKDCDLYTERTILSAMGRKGKVVCDPVCVGYWRHHGKNESYRQNLVSQAEQKKAFADWTDGMMDDVPEWDRHLMEWARIMPNPHLRSYIANMDGIESRYVHAVANVLTMSMKEEVTYDELRRRAMPKADQPLVV